MEIFKSLHSTILTIQEEDPSPQLLLEAVLQRTGQGNQLSLVSPVPATQHSGEHLSNSNEQWAHITQDHQGSPPTNIYMLTQLLHVWLQLEGSANQVFLVKQTERKQEKLHLALLIWQMVEG